MKKIIAITSGDPDGIGLEVTLKALAKLGPQRDTHFVLWRRQQKSTDRFLKLIDGKFKRQLILSREEATTAAKHNILFDLVSPLSPAQWVEQSATFCLKQYWHGLTTGPLSKVAITQSGLKDIGHTDILGRVTKTKTPFMSFLGKHFGIVLATGHIPLSQLSVHLNADILKAAIEQAEPLRSLLPTTIRRKPLALLGLNPHAGESGLIGSEELDIHNEVMNHFKNRIALIGPLSPDAAFSESVRKTFSIAIACYHDQGLIPYKALHRWGEGVHITAGLPIVRTSVEHGTAKDIFGKNKANPSSMLSALKMAIRMAELKFN